MAERSSAGRFVTIEINTRPYTVPHGKITFEDVVSKAYPPQEGQPPIACTVTYHNKHDDHDMKLVPGQSVEAREGMEFTATPTNES